MSIAAINDFFNALDKNEELTQAFEALEPGDNYKQNVIDLAAKFDYIFTLEELNTVIAAALRIKENESAQQ